MSVAGGLDGVTGDSVGDAVGVREGEGLVRTGEDGWGKVGEVRLKSGRLLSPESGGTGGVGRTSVEEGKTDSSEEPGCKTLVGRIPSKEGETGRGGSVDDSYSSDELKGTE